MTQNVKTFVLNAVPEPAILGFKRFATAAQTALAQTSAALHQVNAAMGAGLATAPSQNKVVQNLNAQNRAIQQSTSAQAPYQQQLQRTTSLQAMSTRQVADMTRGMLSYTQAVQGLSKFSPIVGAPINTSVGQYPARPFGGWRHIESGMATQMPSGTAMESYLGQHGTNKASTAEYQRMIKVAGENLGTMSAASMEVQRSFGEVKAAGTDMARVFRAFKDPQNLRYMQQSGQWFVGDKQGVLPGLPGSPDRRSVMMMGSAMTDMQRDWTKGNRENEAAQKEMQRRQGVSFFQLMSLMVKFGAAMAIIQAPGRALEAYGNIRGTSTDLQHQITETGLLVPGIIGQREAFTAATTSLAGKGYLIGEGPDIISRTAQTSTKLASALDAIPSMGRGSFTDPKTGQSAIFDEDMTKLLYMTEQAMVLSALGEEQDPRNATDLITRTAGPLRLRPDSSQMKQIMRSAIATIELGDVQMAGLSDYVGEMIGPFSNIWGSSNRDRQMEAYNEMMMIYGTMTRTLNVQEAQTGARNMLKATISPPVQVEKGLMALKAYGERTGRDFDLTLGALVSEGPMAYYKKNFDVLGPEGAMVNEYLLTSAGQKALAEKTAFTGGDVALAEEIVRTTQGQIYINQRFPNIRGSRGFNAAFAGRGELLNSFQKSYGDLMQQDLVGLRLTGRSTSKAVSDAISAVKATEADLGIYDAEGASLDSQRRARAATMIDLKDKGWGRKWQSFWNNWGTFWYIAS